MQAALMNSPPVVYTPLGRISWTRRTFGQVAVTMALPEDTVEVEVMAKTTQGHSKVWMDPWNSDSKHFTWNLSHKPNSKTLGLMRKYSSQKRLTNQLTGRPATPYSMSSSRRRIGSNYRTLPVSRAALRNEDTQYNGWRRRPSMMKTADHPARGDRRRHIFHNTQPASPDNSYRQESTTTDDKYIEAREYVPNSPTYTPEYSPSFLESISAMANCAEEEYPKGMGDDLSGQDENTSEEDHHTNPGVNLTIACWISASSWKITEDRDATRCTTPLCNTDSMLTHNNDPQSDFDETQRCLGDFDVIKEEPEDEPVEDKGTVVNIDTGPTVTVRQQVQVTLNPDTGTRFRTIGTVENLDDMEAYYRKFMGHKFKFARPLPVPKARKTPVSRQRLLQGASLAMQPSVQMTPLRFQVHPQPHFKIRQF